MGRLRDAVHEAINSTAFTALMVIAVTIMLAAFCGGLMWLRMR